MINFVSYNLSFLRSTDNLKVAAYISFAVFIVMLCGSIVYYKERILFADASHIAFMAINEQKLQIQQYRFGSFITQMVPVIGAKMGVSIRWIMIAYSASFHLFYLFVASIMLFVFKSYRLVIVYAFYWTLVTTYTFFWPNNEVHQGIAYMFLLFPMLLWMGEKKYPLTLSALLLLLLGTTAIFCHPLVTAPFIFLWGYLIAEKKNWPFDRKQTILLSAIVVLIVAAKMYVSVNYADYDNALLHGVRTLQLRDILTAFTSPLAYQIYHHATFNYRILPIIMTIGILTLFIKRRYVLGVWSLGCTLTYFILLCVSFTGYLEFISESEMMAGIIIATTPFVFVTLPTLRKEITIGILLFIFIFRYHVFSGCIPLFKNRVNALCDVLTKMKNRGLTRVVLLKNHDYVEWSWLADWGSSTESIMLSASVWDKPVCQFIIVRPGTGAEKRIPGNKTDVMLCFENWPVSKINMKYFPIDTTKPYTVLSYEEFMK